MHVLQTFIDQQWPTWKSSPRANPSTLTHIMWWATRMMWWATRMMRWATRMMWWATRVKIVEIETLPGDTEPRAWHRWLTQRSTTHLLRMTQSHCQWEKQCNCFRGNTGAASERRVGARMRFTEHLNTIFNGTETEVIRTSDVSITIISTPIRPATTDSSFPSWW